MIRFHHLWTLALLLIPLVYLFLRRHELGSRPIADRLAIALRIASISLLLISLAGPQLLSRAENHYIYFLADLSMSIRPSTSEPLLMERLNAWAIPEPHTQYGLIVFGKQPFVELPFAPSLDLKAIHTEVEPVGTDLSAALKLALTTFPEEGTKTIVLLSDGQSTQGDVSEALVQAAREEVKIFTLPVDPPTSEFSIQDVRVPREVAVDLPFVLQSVIYASKPGRSRLLAYRNEMLISQQELTLHAGLNFVQQSDELHQAGMYEYRMELVAPDDALSPNNTYQALVEAVGDPRILLVEAENESHFPSPLERLLANAGHAYTKASLREFAPTPVSLLSYRAIILNDVALREMSRDQIEQLERYVRDLGGGLWLIQGRQAVEEFYDREFEMMLPVTYEGPEEVQRPALALVMLLDRSGSMGEAVEAMQKLDKIDLLKEAAIGAVEKLDARNYLGIIAFDAKYDWVVPLGLVQNRKNDIAQAIQGLSAEGGTDIYDALRQALAQLTQVRARVKHILVFSDGKVSKENRDFERIFREIQDSTISASSIAIGAQADIDFLWRLAEAGNGVKYEVKDARDLPEITLQELVRIERARWIKGPVPVSPGPFAFELHNLDVNAIPPADGYVLTFEKPAAQTSLQIRTEEDLPADPLISQWQYGLGKVVVLNTSLTQEGLDRWLNWDGLSVLTAEILSQIYSEGPLQLKELTIQTKVEDSHLSVTAEAERDGLWLDLLSLEGHLSGLEGASQTLVFEQVGPGHYRATVEDLPEGVYLLRVDEKSLGRVEDVVNVPYAAEYRRISLNQEALSKIARATGGEYLEDAGTLPPRLQDRTRSYRDIWQPIALVALFFFLVDLIARKLPMPRS
ncbi:MAG: hypothetical protein A2Z21_09650 [Candidatus Fraserbacteria bacterium RBG_16_55_9]|uniref:VWFA domain-containing protein n=1 Tax=Fraserbacteria sp. (strain RBG_16_55_9) TaxID=1817864 RepID=A0A1F5UQ15_FRAXR|nr:MAG: hypothetical protein A2Z21_09650 [Candidatus Fraserbacteria bacterium RBG_16_55_9]